MEIRQNANKYRRNYEEAEKMQWTEENFKSLSLTLSKRGEGITTRKQECFAQKKKKRKEGSKEFSLGEWGQAPSHFKYESWRKI